MKKEYKLSFLTIVALVFSTSLVQAQQLTVHDPQVHYDEAGGLYDKDIVRSMFVDFENPGYHGILVTSFFNNPSMRIPATVSLDDIVIDSVAVRYKGNSTFCLPNDEGNVKVPYNLDFNYWHEDSELMGYHKVKLANAWVDPTFAKEYVGAQIYQRYLPSPEVNLIALHTQEEYTGIYVNTESINKQFLRKHFDENDGVLFKCDGSGVFCGDEGEDGGIPSMHWLGTDSTDYYNSYVLKSDHGWAELMDLIYTINLNPSEIENKLNVDRVLWAFAANQVLLNLDTYNGYYIHNYYMYLSENGLWQMIPWDMDNTFVGALLGWDYYNPNNLYHYTPYMGENEGDYRPLAHLLLNNPLYRKQYNAHMRTIMEESLDASELEAEAFEIQALAENMVTADNNKLFPMNLHTQNVSEAIFTGWGFGGISSSAAERLEYLESLPELNVNAPEIYSISLGSVVHNLDGNPGTFMPILASINSETSVQLMATTSEYNSHFVAYEMANLGGGTYQGLLPIDLDNPEDWKFYIRAMNEEAMTLSPARAEYEFYEFTSPVGIETAFTPASFSIVPNPSSTKFSFRGIASAELIRIYDSSGRLVHEQTALFDVVVEDWEPGVYTVEVRTETGQTDVQRLVVCE